MRSNVRRSSLRRSHRATRLFGTLATLVAWLVAASVGAAEPVAAPAKRPAFVNPPQVSSINGVLDLTLRVEMAELKIRGKKVATRVYNGEYVPPTLRVKPGDKIRITLINGIDFTTNLHTHGMNVSPLNNGDNIFLHIEPGETFHYEIDLPMEHPEGLFYYHPHEPGLTETQIMGGMSGLLVVEGLLDPFPQLAGITELQMVLKDTQIKKGQIPDDIDPSAKTNRTLNGLKNPTIRMRPGETQLWRIGNIGADLYYRLQFQKRDRARRESSQPADRAQAAVATFQLADRGPRPGEQQEEEVQVQGEEVQYRSGRG